MLTAAFAATHIASRVYSVLSMCSTAGQLAGGSRKREPQSACSYVCLSQGPSQDAEGVHHPVCA